MVQKLLKYSVTDTKFFVPVVTLSTQDIADYCSN